MLQAHLIFYLLWPWNQPLLQETLISFVTEWYLYGHISESFQLESFYLYVSMVLLPGGTKINQV